MASIAGGGGIAREMFVRVHWTNNRFSGADSAATTPPLHPDSYLSNAHLPLSADASVAVLLVGELRSFALTAPWLQANVISSIGTDSVDVFAAVRPLPAAAAGSACGQVRSRLSNVVSCHEVPTITGAQNVTLFHFGMLNMRPSPPVSLSSSTAGYGNTPWIIPPHVTGIMGGPANYHRWGWGGWASDEAGNFGAPAGHYQYQVLAFAFGVMLRAEQSASARYSHVIKVRADVWAQGVLPSAGQFSSIFEPDKAYIFGERRRSGVGVIPQ